MNCSRVLGLAFSIALPFVGTFVMFSIFGDQPDKEWRESLKQPQFMPPPWVFAVVWTLLYIGMGVASYLLCISGDGLRGKARLPLIMYAINFIILMLFTPIAATKRLDYGLAYMVIVDVSVLACLITFYRVNKVSMFLYIPLMVWVTLATALTYKQWELNK